MMHHVLDDRERLELVARGNAAFVELLGRLFSAERRRRKPNAGAREALKPGDPEERAYLSLFDRHAVRATLEEVAALYLDEDKKMVLDFSESRELVALLRPSARAPLEYTGVRWSLYRSPNRALAKDQDFCYLEVMRPFTSPGGRRGWAKCSHSVEHRMCPDLSASPKIAVTRGRLHYCGVAFLETDEPGVLDGIFYYNVARAHIPSLVASVVMKARGRNNARLLNHYAKMARLVAQQQQQLGGDMSSGAKAAFAKQLRAERRCGACSDRLPGWKARAKCVFCKSYMCSKCSSIVQCNYRVRDIGRNHVCFTCAEQHGARLAKPPAAITSEDAAGASDAGSDSFRFDDSDTATFDGDDALSSVATATDDESEGTETDEHLHLHPHASTGVARRRSSSSGDGSVSSVIRSKSAADMHHGSSSDHRPLVKVRSVPHLTHTSQTHTSQAHHAALVGRPPPPPPTPEPAYQRSHQQQHRPRPLSSDKIAAAVAGLADLGSPKGLDLDQVNLRHRSQTTSAVPSHSHGRSKTSATNQRERAATTATTYSRENPCDLSYLSGFK